MIAKLKSSFNKPIYYFFLITLFSFLARLLIGFGLGPGFDEAYYYSYSLNPSLSYFDHPPMVSIMAGLFPKILTITSIFTVRLSFILLFTISGIILFKFARSVMDESSALMTLFLFSITPLFLLAAGTMILPDGPLLFFWIFTIIYYWKILKGDTSLKNWIIAGIFTGLSMLSKYHGVLLGFSLILYILIYQRHLLKTPGIYLFGLSAILIFLPVILWNIQHDFISFRFQAGRAVSSSIDLSLFFQGLVGQAGYLTPFVFFPMLYVIWLTIREGHRDDEYRFYLFFGTLPVLIFNLIAFFREILPHWTLPGYILLLLPLGKYLSTCWQTRKYGKPVIIGSASIIVLLLILAYSHTRYGIFHLEKLAEKGIVSEKDFRKDVTLDVVGWDALGNYILENYEKSGVSFLFTHKWFLSGEVALSVKGEFPVMCFNKRDPRGFGIWDSDLDMRGKTGLFICSNRFNKNPFEVYADYFEKISEPKTLIISRGGVPSKTFYLYECKNLLKRYPIFQ